MEEDHKSSRKNSHQSASKRQRVDSILGAALNGSNDFKIMRTGDHTWSKIDNIINKSTTKLMLFELPKGVSSQKLIE